MRRRVCTVRRKIVSGRLGELHRRSGKRSNPGYAVHGAGPVPGRLQVLHDRLPGGTVAQFFQRLLLRVRRQQRVRPLRCRGRRAVLPQTGLHHHR